jgi:hypothetical protein
VISKLILCYELSLDELNESVSFLNKKLRPKEILCLKPDELKIVNLEDYSIYCFHFDLNNEINTHADISRWLLKNDYGLLNPYSETHNIFDDKYLFSQFLLANQILHPQTEILDSFKHDCGSSLIVKARHGTEKKDFADYSKEAFEKIALYDDVVVQEKIDIKNEIKVLYLDGSLYANQIVSSELKEQVQKICNLIGDYLSQNKQDKVYIYSIDILEDKESNYYFLELNLRPGAFYRFKESFNRPLSKPMVS